MFTGIIEATGLIEAAEITPANTRLIINAPKLGLHNVAIGDSVAVNGCCLTVVEKSPETFSVDVSQETLSLTAGLQQGAEVNLEKSLRFGDRLGGHLVSGHVDGIGTVTAIDDLGASWRLEIEAPGELAKFVARKGSITINGISLTVNRVRDLENGRALFEINIIPHTHQVTTIRLLRKGSKVNLEIDLLARYLERMLGK
ncbi:MAG TPA: riboflavin synthase [Usitatibacteraceae bacterium]